MSNASTQEDRTDADRHSMTVEAAKLDRAVTLTASLVEECHLTVDETKLRLYGVDPATAAFVDVRLQSVAFERYQVSRDHVGVSLSRLGDVTGMAHSGQAITLALDAETRRLDISLGELSYTLATLDPATVRSPPGESARSVDLPATVGTDAETLSQAVRAAEMVSNHLALGVDSEQFLVEASGDSDDVSLTMPAGELATFEPAETHSLFSVAYLRAIEKALPAGCPLTLELGTEKPVRIRAEFAAGAGTVEYLVSPRLSQR